MRSTNGRGGNRRRRKLVRLDLQLKVVFITLFVTCLVLLINFQLNLAGLWSLFGRFADSEESRTLLDAFRRATIQKFLLSVGMALPLAASVGVLYSFKFCGPIYRFKEYFTHMQDGGWNEPLALRKNDDLQDVCRAINGGLHGLREHVRSQHEFTREVAAFLEAHGEPSEPAEREHIERLRARIAEAEEVWRRRFERTEDEAPRPVDAASGSATAGSEAVPAGVIGDATDGGAASVETSTQGAPLERQS